MRMRAILFATAASGALALAGCQQDAPDAEEAEQAAETEEDVVLTDTIDEPVAEDVTVDPLGEEAPYADLTDEVTVDPDDAEREATRDSVIESEPPEFVVDETRIGADVYFEDDVIGVIRGVDPETGDVTVALTRGEDAVIAQDAFLISPDGWIVAEGIGGELTESGGVDVVDPGPDAEVEIEQPDDGDETD